MTNPRVSPGISTRRPVIRKSIIIRTCSNKHCNMRYEITEDFQSHKFCPDCRKPAVCVHNIPTIERCSECFKKHRSWFMRTM